MRRLVFAVIATSLGFSAAAQEPGQQPTNLNFFNIKPYGFNLNFTPEQCDGFLILRSTSPINFVPQDGVEYQKGEGVAPGVKVFALGASSSASIKEVIAGARYYFAIYSFNNYGSAIDYKNTNPLTGFIDVPTGGPGNYYHSVSGSSSTFLADLKQRLNTGRVFQSYTPGYINNLMTNFYIRDTLGAQQVSICQYTGKVYISDPPYTWWGTAGDPGELSREHALPRSWMHTGGNTNSQDGADYHNLFPVDQEKANAKRSNHPYGIVQNVTYQFLDGKLGTNSQGFTVYEPRDDMKGDVARAQFYMMVCYNGNSGTWGYTVMPSYAQQQSQELLKNWHEQDPPDAFEKTRHEYIYSVQYNRNPFIDYPDLVACINFDNMTLYTSCAITIGIDEETLAGSLKIFPNPASEALYIQTEGENIVEIIVMDMNGRLIIQKNAGNLSFGSDTYIDVSSLTNGMYSVTVRTNKSVSVEKIVLNK